MDIGHTLLLIALALQFHNIGTIWFVQLVAYPLFKLVGTAEYIPYHRFYTSRIPMPVILPGFLSFFMPIVLIFGLPTSVPLWLAYANVAMGIVGLLVTVLLEIPRHGRLEREGKQPKVNDELIRFNWPRTASITLSAGLTFAMVLHAFAPV
jgi:hypothetical protein